MSAAIVLYNLKKKVQCLRDDIEKLRGLYDGKRSECEEEKSKNIDVEARVVSLTRALQLSESEKDQFESRYQQTVDKFNEVTLDLDEHKRMQKVNISQRTTNEEMIGALEKQISVLKSANDEVEKKYEEMARKLSLTETEFEKAEERREIAESKLKHTDDKLQIVSNNMRSLQVNELLFVSKEENYGSIISTLTKKLKEAQDTTENQARELKWKNMELERTEKILIEKQNEYASLWDELDTCYREVQSI